MMMHTLTCDLRFAARTLRKSPGATLAAVVIMALGIGANSTIFSLVNALLLGPLNVSNPERLVSVYTSRVGGQLHGNTSYPDYLDYKARNEVFSILAAQTYAPMALRGSEQARIVIGQLVSWDYFAALGVEPALGRTFRQEEDATFGTHPVAILSHATWAGQFGSDPGIVGTTIRINDYPFTVIGVAPRGFEGLVASVQPAVWAPLAMAERALPYTPNIESRVDPWLQLVGRLRPGIASSDAQAALDVLAANLVLEHPDLNRGKGIVLKGLDGSRLATPEVTDATRRVMAILMGVVGFVLLIACLNVSAVQLARANGRSREIALRQALGASRWRIVRQLLVESVTLSLVAGAAGLWVATFAIDLLQALQPRSEFPLQVSLHLDARVLGFTLLLAVSAGVLSGLAPALQALRPSESHALKERGYALSQSRASGRWQRALVIAQIALSLALLCGAGLLVRSLRNTLAIDPGFDLKDGVVLPLNLGFGQYDQQQGEAFRAELLERTATLPGVESAALAAFIPLGPIHGHHDVYVEGYDPVPDELMLVKRNMVSAGYFETMGIRVVSGRPIDGRDSEDAAPVAMVNETMARRFWPDRDPIGRTVQADLGRVYTVVGVIEDGKYSSLREQPEAYLVLPLSQGEYVQRVNLVARKRGDPGDLIKPLRSEVERLVPGLPSPVILTMREYLQHSVGDVKGPAILVGAFGLLALLLAAVGLYGVMYRSVTQRKREFGVRLALGASEQGLVKMVLGQGLRTTLIGVGVGLLLALAVTRLLSGLLLGVGALDPLVFGLVSGILLAIGQLASYLPARFASRADPVATLRLE
ncbi:MAG: ABC transporter permease [Gemmatimonadales bacterium]|jgi:putative ABC transport system permease protein